MTETTSYQALELRVRLCEMLLEFILMTVAREGSDYEHLQRFAEEMLVALKSERLLLDAESATAEGRR